MSIFLNDPIALDLAAMRTGLGWARSWARNPILCRIGDGWMRLIVVDQPGFLASWAWPLPDIEQPQFFLLPSFVASTLSGPAAWEAENLEVVVKGNLVGLILRAGQQEFRLQWRWSAADFKAPREFTMMSQLPNTMMTAPYVSLSDMVHLAIANLMNPALAESDVLQEEGTVVIDFMPGQINIDGETIKHENQQARYFFNPRILVRGLEIVRERQISFAMQATNRGHDSIIYLSSHREGWQVHCAVLSAGMSTEVPTTAIRIRETRPPMQDGSWLTSRPR